jgi:hypothetical protein
MVDPKKYFAEADRIEREMANEARVERDRIERRQRLRNYVNMRARSSGLGRIYTCRVLPSGCILYRLIAKRHDESQG